MKPMAKAIGFFFAHRRKEVAAHLLTAYFFPMPEAIVVPPTETKENSWTEYLDYRESVGSAADRRLDPGVDPDPGNLVNSARCQIRPLQILRSKNPRHQQHDCAGHIREGRMFVVKSPGEDRPDDARHTPDALRYAHRCALFCA